jgi:hypothetical protein
MRLLKNIPLLADTPATDNRASAFTILVLLGLLGISILGFIPVYFFAFGSIRASIHIHTLLMYLWFGGLVAMAVLIRTRHYKWHRYVGYASPLLVLSILASGLVVTAESLKVDLSELNMQVIGRQRLPFMAMGAFSLVYIFGICFRKNPDLHYRMMVSTGILIVGPALRRILLFIPWTQPNFATISFAVLAALTVALIFLDFREGRHRSPYFLTLFLIGTMQIGYLYWEDIFG